MIEIKGKINTAICYATVVEDEAIEHGKVKIDFEKVDAADYKRVCRCN